ncbi:MAG: DUF3343 domain-containing protein [Eubacteriales bacterium]|jgi:hypothetical protein
MKQKKIFRVLTFHTTHDAMALEAYCGEQGIPGRIIPVPRELTAGCGLAWRMDPSDYEKYREQIEASGLSIEQSAEVGLYVVVKA